MPRKKKTINDILEDINGYFEESIVLSDFDKDMLVIPTGSLALDISTGVGGIPRGRITELYGAEMSGKTSVALAIMRENSINGEGFSVFVDAEHSLNIEYVKAVLGEHFRDDDLYVQPKTLEQTFELLEACIRSGQYSLIILDSVAALAAKAEQEDTFSENPAYGLLPRLLNRFLKRALFDIRDRNIAFVVTNQVRDKIGAYVSSYETPGGHGLKHALSLRIMFSKGDAIKKKTDDTDAIGHNVNFTVKKNKVGTPFRSATTNVIYGQGIDKERDVIAFGSLLGVIERNGSFYRFEGENLGSTPGVASAAEALKEKPEVLDKIAEVCYNVVGVRRHPTREE